MNKGDIVVGKKREYRGIMGKIVNTGYLTCKVLFAEPIKGRKEWWVEEDVLELLEPSGASKPCRLTINLEENAERLDGIIEANNGITYEVSVRRIRRGY